MNFKTAFFVALVLLLVSNFGWFYIFIDQAVTYTYTKEESEYQRKTLSLVKSMLLDFSRNIDKKEMVTILNKKYSNHLIKKDDGYLFIDNVGLKFDKGKLIEIVYMNEL